MTITEQHWSISDQPCSLWPVVNLAVFKTETGTKYDAVIIYFKFKKAKCTINYFLDSN